MTNDSQKRGHESAHISNDHGLETEPQLAVQQGEVPSKAPAPSPGQQPAAAPTPAPAPAVKVPARAAPVISPSKAPGPEAPAPAPTTPIPAPSASVPLPSAPQPPAATPPKLVAAVPAPAPAQAPRRRQPPQAAPAMMPAPVPSGPVPSPSAQVFEPCLAPQMPTCPSLSPCHRRPFQGSAGRMQSRTSLRPWVFEVGSDVYRLDCRNHLWLSRSRKSLCQHQRLKMEEWFRFW